MPHELKKAIEDVITAYALSSGNVTPRMDRALDHLVDVYEPIKDKL